MNATLEVLAVDSHALRRMRKHLEVNPGWPDDIQGDIEMLAIEVERVTRRLTHWEDVVARVRMGLH